MSDTPRQRNWFSLEVERLRTGKTRDLYAGLTVRDLKITTSLRHEVARKHMRADLPFDEAFAAIKFAHECGMARIVLRDGIAVMIPSHPDIELRRHPVWDPAKEKVRYE